MKSIFSLISFLLPWSLRRRILERVFGFSIHPTSRIGLSVVLPRYLVMEQESRIGHLTVCKGLERLHLCERASIGNLNWITGFPHGVSRHFAHQQERHAELIIQPHAAVANRHLIDCTARVSIGAYSILGGFSSQILTHSVDIEMSRQSSEPVEIGDYCFIGTNCVILGGSSLPDHSVLGAKSLLNKKWAEPYHIYAGVPAKPVKPIVKEAKYFHRREGFVW